jgi:hypothetical protein
MTDQLALLDGDALRVAALAVVFVVSAALGVRSAGRHERERHQP